MCGSILFRKFCGTHQRYLVRTLTKIATRENLNDDYKINAWQLHEYGGIDSLKLTRARSPIIHKPDDVLVEVKASSVNPIDVAMTGGYGSVLINVARQFENCSLSTQIEFPLTLGRDFCGVVADTGFNTKYKIGDEVWGVVPVQQQGSHAEKVVVNQSMVHSKPTTLTTVEAGSMLYAAMTAWSALKITGDLAIVPVRGKNVLVLGGSGGVGTMAVQMLRSWGAHVVSTCNKDAVPFLESLNVSCIIDYTTDEADRLIKQEGKHDIILDCAGLGMTGAYKYSHLLKEFKFSKYITLKSPTLQNVNEYGIIGGMVKNAGDLLSANVGLFTKSSSVRWAFFLPIFQGLEEISEEVNTGKLLPCVDSTFKFEDACLAYQKVQEGHLRGKVVIDHSG